MRMRKWRNYAIGFLLAATLYVVLAYLLVDFVADQFIRQMVPETGSETVLDLPDKVSGDSDKPDQKTGESNAGQMDSGPTHGTDGTFEATDQRVKSIQGSLTLNEKLTITSILADKFTSEEVEWFVALASGGLTNAEKKQMRSKFLDKLTEAEYNALIGIAAKYGLSEGKKYDEQIKKQVR